MEVNTYNEYLLNMIEDDNFNSTFETNFKIVNYCETYSRFLRGVERA